MLGTHAVAIKPMGTVATILLVKHKDDRGTESQHWPGTEHVGRRDEAQASAPAWSVWFMPAHALVWLTLLGAAASPVQKSCDCILCPALNSSTSRMRLHILCCAAGVSECIIMGMPMPTGTGLFKLRQDTGQHTMPAPRPLPLLAY